VNAAKTILPVVFDISSPCLAPDLDHNSIHWTHELDKNQRRPISLLIQIRIVDGRIALIWPELYLAYVLLVKGPLTFTGDANMFWGPSVS